MQWIQTASQEVLAKYYPYFSRAMGKGWGSSSIQEEVEATLSLLKNTQEELLIFDIGANLGDYSAYVLENFVNSRLILFEPSSSAFDQLKNRFRNESRVTLVNKACGFEEKYGTLYFDKPGSGMASLTRRRTEHFGISFDLEEVVTITTVDEYCQAHNLTPDVIKLDVEGHELEVLKGSLKSLSQVKCVQFEFGGCNIDTKTYFQDFHYFFSELGFEIYRITPKGLFKIDYYSEWDECFLTTNFVAYNSRNSQI